jgi:hypothetical protein
MPKTAYVIKIQNVRGTESTEGVKNYGGIYPYAYMTEETAVAKASALARADGETFGKAVRMFEIVDVNIGDKSFEKLVAAKAANKDADVPLYLIRLAAHAEPREDVKLYGGVYPWAYADSDDACAKMDALDESDSERFITVYPLKGLAGLKEFIPARPAPAPAPTCTRPGCGCQPNRTIQPTQSAQQTVAGTLSGTTSSGGRVTGAFVGVIEGGE